MIAENFIDKRWKSTFDRIIYDVTVGRNIILYGQGGCSKSYTIKEIAKHLINNKIRVYVTALTGVAAVNLGDCSNDVSISCSCTTLHHFAGIGVSNLEAKDLVIIMRKKYPNAIKKWMKCQVLIIDEVSMLGKNLFEKLDFIAKAIRGNDEVFGGIQLILSGDFLQLPPVKDEWVFLSERWHDLKLRPFILNTPYRFGRIDFFNMLARVRTGESTEVDIQTLRARVKAHRQLQNLLKQYTSGVNAQANIKNIIKPTVFYSKRYDVENYNIQELAKLPGEFFTFTAKDDFVKIKGTPKREDYTKLLDDDIPPVISFKIGAQVMLKKNLSVEEGFVNGSRGVINAITSKQGEHGIVPTITVKFLNGTKDIEPTKKMFEDKHARITRTQIPLVLAYACTIHKSQGSTIDYAIMDLGESIFTEGQAYVALSRCRNIRGIFISSFSETSIMANKLALKYSTELEHMAFYENFGCTVEMLMIVREFVYEDLFNILLKVFYETGRLDVY